MVVLQARDKSTKLRGKKLSTHPLPLWVSITTVFKYSPTAIQNNSCALGMSPGKVLYLLCGSHCHDKHSLHVVYMYINCPPPPNTPVNYSNCV